MSKLHFGTALVAVALTATAQAADNKKIDEKYVMKVHKSAILIDTHNDITSRTVAGLDIGKPSSDTHTDLPRMKEGGMGAQFFAVYVASNYVKDNHSANRTLQMIDTVRHDIIEKYPNDFYFSTTADDILKAHKQHKIAALMGIEGGHAIEDSLRLLRDFYALGIRYMTLTHTNTNNWADSSGDKPLHNGLTPFGKEVVLEMNRLGMIVDISHVADKTFYDALETSKAPIFASHSSCKALADVPRNMTDDMITALGKKGGVVQINFNCGFLSGDYAKADAAAAAEMRPQIEKAREEANGDFDKFLAKMAAIRAENKTKLPEVTIDDVVAHIDHVVKIAGVDHVGIGSDFDGVFCVPKDLDSVSKFPNLTRKLLEKGYSPADIRKIYGGNTIRLMRDVERTAKQLQASVKP